MIRFMRTAALLAALLPAGIVTSVAADETILFATEAAFPPFNMRADDGSIIGWEIELGMAMCERVNLKCEFVAQEWDGMIPGLLAKKYTAIFGAMQITEQRSKVINFTDKYFRAVSSFLAAEGTEIDFDDKKLGGLAIGTYPGTTQCFLDAHYPDANYRIYKTATDLALDLNAGRIDVMVGQIIQADSAIIRKYPEKNYVFIGEPVEYWDTANCFGPGGGIGVRKEDKELLALLNKAIKMVRDDGTYEKLSVKYFGRDIYE